VIGRIILRRAPQEGDIAASPAQPDIGVVERLMQVVVGALCLLIGVGSRRRSVSQAIDLPSDGGGQSWTLVYTG